MTPGEYWTLIFVGDATVFIILWKGWFPHRKQKSKREWKWIGRLPHRWRNTVRWFFLWKAVILPLAGALLFVEASQESHQDWQVWSAGFLGMIALWNWVQLWAKSLPQETGVGRFLHRLAQRPSRRKVAVCVALMGLVMALILYLYIYGIPGGPLPQQFMNDPYATP